MKVEQRITVEGSNVVLRLIEHPSGRELARRIWEGAGKYVRPASPKGTITIVAPARAGLDIKPS